MSQHQMLLGLIFYWCYMVHDAIMEPCGYHGSLGPGAVGCYLIFSSGVLMSTSSHICGNWYLPMFLFRDGLLTLINTASLMALAIYWSSLPTMLKLCRDSSWPVMLWWSWLGDVASCVLWTFLQIFCLIPQYTHPHSPPCHTCTCWSPHFSAGWCPYLWGVPGSPWWYCLIWNTFQPHVFCRCSCSFHSGLAYMEPLYKAVCCLCWSWSY